MSRALPDAGGHESATVAARLIAELANEGLQIRHRGAAAVGDGHPQADLSELMRRLEQLETVVLENARSRPFDIKALLWDWRRDPCSTPEERWAWISRTYQYVRGHASSFLISPDLMMCRVLGRYTLIFGVDDGLLTARLMNDGLWELNLTEAIVADLSPGMVALDIGANVGYYTLIMADLVGPGGSVFCFEPNQKLHSAPTRSIETSFYDDRVTLIREPVFRESGVVLPFFSPPDTKNSRLLLLDPDARGDGITRLTTTTVDDTFPAGSRIDIVKIDVEGAEFDVWHGMRRVISENQDIRIFIEVNSSRGYDLGELLDMFVATGFPLAYVDDFWGVQPVTRERVLTDNQGQDWVLYLSRAG